MYEITEWNVFSRFEEDLDRTTNCQEGYHNHLRIVAGHSHLNIRQLVKLLIEENICTENKARQHLINGLPAVKRSKTSKSKMENLQMLYDKFCAGIIPQTDYIYAISRNIAI